jgi:serine/threonine-protein kinase HipA
MIFNAVVGNDDDHPRNHAVIFDATENRWRLAPAFDVVPNPEETPKLLVMQVSTGRRDIDREAMLTDYARFGFKSRIDAEQYMDALLKKIQSSFNEIKDMFGPDLEVFMSDRINTTSQRLAASTAQSAHHL